MAALAQIEKVGVGVTVVAGVLTVPTAERAVDRGEGIDVLNRKRAQKYRVQQGKYGGIEPDPKNER